MKVLRKSMMIFGILCIVVGFIPWRDVTTKNLADGAIETNQRITLGIPRSPFVLLERSETQPGPGVVQPDGSIVHKGLEMHSGVSMNFISWSMLSLILGVLLIDGPKLWSRTRDWFQPTKPSPIA